MSRENFGPNLKAILVLIKGLGQETINRPAPDLGQSEAALAAFQDATKDIRAETYRVSGHVQDALHVSSLARASSGQVTLSGLRGLNNHPLARILCLVETQGKPFTTCRTVVRVCRILCPVLSHWSLRVYILQPTTKNTRILQCTYGRALGHKNGLAEQYKKVISSEYAGVANKRSKYAYEDESLLRLPQRHRIGIFADMHVRQPKSETVTKAEENELLLAFRRPYGGLYYAEVTSGESRKGSEWGEVDLVIGVSEKALERLYKLYIEMKGVIAQRKSVAVTQEADERLLSGTTYSDVALSRRM